ncbi:hypothetical protein CLIB1444_04S01178 [[Candida] jaroonii]|uniref:Uncharacterized protein n=1 Tax=[Candida] jaroonii TaxID=467808 RepID=A0ACA9Y774_9ASCO|nr:hypothetical protein CLIB1444_04S01178 [[Candida] jaroonii]
MGSCFSSPDGRTLNEKVDGGVPKGSKAANARTNSGHSLGGTNEGDSRASAARAAQMRYDQVQQSKKDSEVKLQAMKKMSRSEKGI